MKKFSSFAPAIAAFKAAGKIPPRSCRRAAARLIWRSRPKDQYPGTTWKDHWIAFNGDA